MQLNALMATNEKVRTQFARIVNAAPEEIGLLNSTGEGENMIANGIGLKAGTTWWWTICTTTRSSFFTGLWKLRAGSSCGS